MVAAFSIAVAVGFARVFSGWEFLTTWPSSWSSATASAFVLRRLRLTPWIAVPVAARRSRVDGRSRCYYPTTFSLGAADRRHLGDPRIELDLVREQFRTAVAPVIYGGGWDVLAGHRARDAVLLADVFAFRAEARAEALVPGGVLFVFVAALGDDGCGSRPTVLLVGAASSPRSRCGGYHAERATD